MFRQLDKKKLTSKTALKNLGIFLGSQKRRQMSQNHRKITLARDLRENFWQSGLLSLLGMDLKDMKTIWENLGEAEQVTSQ